MNKSSPIIMGISASHNGGVCLLRGDEILVAIQEERLTRRKRTRVFGSQAALSITYCLEHANLCLNDIDMIVLCPQSDLTSPKHDLTQNPILGEAARSIPIEIIPHHYGHAISVFAASGFADSAVLVVDGVGSTKADLFDNERQYVNCNQQLCSEVVSFYDAKGINITPLLKHMAPEGTWLESAAWLGPMCPTMPRFQSLGGMYSSVAVQIFGDMDDCGKVMGLAPYGKPTIPVEEFFEVNEETFIFSNRVPLRFQHADRWPSHQREYENLAASVQQALEFSLFELCRQLRRRSTNTNLCYAGGVALNGVANERIIRECGFENVFIIPSAEDSGAAIGAAYFGLWQLTGDNSCRRLKSDGLGAVYSSSRISSALITSPALTFYESTDIIDETVSLLAAGKIVGWFQGGAELGPRALGSRSILCDPRLPNAKDFVNARVKGRESFRPFAPAILHEEVKNWFELNHQPTASPFMLRVALFRDDRQSLIPAVVHVDGTGRLQTVTPEDNGLFYELIRRFYDWSGVPILLNTSFNLKGEPIVETPEDAIWCFLFSQMDCLILGNYVVKKQKDYKSVLDLQPLVIAKDISFAESPIKSSEKVLNVTVDTPWGRTTHKCSPDVLGIIETIPTTISGWDLLTKRGQNSSDPQFDANKLIEILGQLVRYRIITFKEVDEFSSRRNEYAC